MRIGIDISQLAYPNTGVSNYLENLVLNLVEDETQEYILFFASLRGKVPVRISQLAIKPNVTIKKVKIPSKALHVLWNIVHKVPIETFIGPVDLFITSDWTEPPTRKAKKATILYDLIVHKYPDETDKRIVYVQKRKLHWVKKESDMVVCISESTKKDSEQILGLDSKKLKVIYPGLTL